MLLQGFSSGLPLALTGSTLTMWLSTEGVSKTTVGAFSLVGTAYAAKYLWSPAVDHVRLPGLARLGRRRSWMLPVQLGLVLALVAMGRTDPVHALGTTAALAVVVAFLSATQDIGLDAWRIEQLHRARQPLGAAATQWGYRIGMIASGAGAMYAAEAWGWSVAYNLMAALMGVGLVATALARDPAPWPPTTGLGDTVRQAIIDPFRDFSRRRWWAAVLLAVVLYKLGDALAGTMTSPLYVELKFTLAEIASVTKVFGVIAGMAGVGAGALLTVRVGTARALLLCGVAQMLSNLGYIVLWNAGHDLYALTAVIGIENFTGGMGSAAFVTWLSAMCARRYTATQYALLSSFAAVGRTMLAANGGWMAEAWGWTPFFLGTIVAAVPGLVLVGWLARTTEDAETLTPVATDPLGPGPLKPPALPER
ncbi:MAG: AmpG family muropeptide MFS transporter [Deltaproteobacteria bacterium]|nr:AmpG family muropeptide MFS transporter [Deltaproteobacteria bacterium]